MFNEDLSSLPTFDSSCLLIVNAQGMLSKLCCPFFVQASVTLPFLELEGIYEVQAVMVSKEGVLVYYILGKAYFYFNFIILF